MLRHVVGNDNFFNILKTYASDTSVTYGAAETSDFQRNAEQVSGMDLDYFFNQWIYGENYPRYSYGWNYTPSGDNYIVTITITQQTNTEPLFFTMPIDIAIKSAQGDTTISVFNDQQIQQFSFTVSNEPLNIILDQDNWILKEASITEVSDDEPIIDNSFNLAQNYPNPFNPSTTIEFSLPADTKNELIDVKVKVFDILGNEIGILLDNKLQPGKHSVIFDTSNFATPLASGIYIYQIITKNFVQSKKMALVR